MDFFSKINLLHLFMFLLFIIGLLLIIITFSAYSKLGTDCKSQGLRTKLRWAICIGTTFISLSIGYTICISRQDSNCDFGERANWKTYIMLILLMGMGGGLLTLSTGIKKDLSCNIDLGSTPDILTALSIAQIILPILYIIWILYMNKTENSNNQLSDINESQAIEAKLKTDIINKSRANRYKNTIAQKSRKLSYVRNQIEISKHKNKNPKIKNTALEKKLIKEIDLAEKGLSLVDKPSTTNYSKNFSDDDSSDFSGDFSIFGNKMKQTKITDFL